MGEHRIPPKPPHFDTVPEGTCRWCNEEIGLTPKGKASKSRWHKLCVKAFKLLFWPSTTRKGVWSRDKGKCKSCAIVCDKKGKNGWQMDHIVPLIEGTGELSFWQLPNLQTLCVPCHKSKTSQEASNRSLIRKLNKTKI